jgi:queuine tRNA-ribosyltransferase
MHPVEFTEEAIDGSARAGVAVTARGAYTTPCFMPVGTRGAVRYLSAADYEDLGAQIVLGNTYHLMLRPGADLVAAMGGLGKFSGWNGHTLTDSGGFQVFSLEPKVDDEGVTFKSTYDGTVVRYTPENAIEVQQLLGADIQMILDVCPALPSPPHVIDLALKRTTEWAKRGRSHHSRADQSLFGIVQGGIDPELREQSAIATASLEFDGYGIGGLSVGETRAEMLPALAAAIRHLPRNRPRYLMGVGDPASLVEAVALGVDQFDCVLQTRLGRHGTALTSTGKVHMKNAQHARDEAPLDVACRCDVCRRHSRSFIRHLFQTGEPTAGRLLSYHNVAWTLNLMADMRSAIVAGTFQDFRAEVMGVWGR